MALAERPIIVDCPTFNEKNGGAIVLHMLVDQLRSIGVQAYAANLGHDYSNVKSPFMRALKKCNRRRRRGSFKTHPSMEVPLAPIELYEDAIIVYPETRSGNPLKSKRVVRWLLHKPGFFGVDAKIEPSDILFYYQKAFVDGITGVPAGRLLQVRWIRDDIYQNLNMPRLGTCRMIRKGKYGLGTIPEHDESILLDGKSHTEIAKIFNTTEVFYSHDPHTLYLYYAVLCGCVPVVIPQPGINSREWRAGNSDAKYGVAYGESEIEWAHSTSNQLRIHMDELRNGDLASVRSFVAFLRTEFD